MTEPAAGPGSERRPNATLRTGAGVAILGISASVFLVVSARGTDPAEFSNVAVLWTLVYTVGVGLFLPFEQELSHAAVVRRAAGLPLRPLLRRTALAASLVLVALLAALCLVVLATPVGGLLFDRPGPFLFAAALTCTGFAVQYVQRGILSAGEDFTGYGAQLATEGTLRAVACLALFALGVDSALPYALVLALAPLLSALVVAPRVSRLAPAQPGHPVARWSEVAGGIGLLVLSALCSQLLANVGAIAVRLLAEPEQAAAAGIFLSGLTLARIPMLLFAAIQAIQVPRLTAHLTVGDHSGMLAQLRAFVLVTAGLATAGALGAWALGPWAMQLLYGPAYDMPRQDLALLAASSGLLMMAMTLQSAAIARRRHRRVVAAWAVGVAITVLALALPLELFLRVEVAMMLGATGVIVLLAPAAFAPGVSPRR